MRDCNAAAKIGRLYQAVAERIARSIASGQYRKGDRLPAERDLAAQYDVSRPTVREAIIALEIDGLVEVRVGSGVYVAERKPKSAPAVMDIGAFELTEARLHIEGEVAALAATHITDGELEELERLVAEMNRANDKGGGELVDQKFHEAIARISRNSAMLAIIEQLWTIRNRSPQCVRIFEKSRDKGYVPVVDEHSAIVEALRTRDPNLARARDAQPFEPRAGISARRDRGRGHRRKRAPKWPSNARVLAGRPDERASPFVMGAMPPCQTE